MLFIAPPGRRDVTLRCSFQAAICCLRLNRMLKGSNAFILGHCTNQLPKAAVMVQRQNGEEQTARARRRFAAGSLGHFNLSSVH